MIIHAQGDLAAYHEWKLDGVVHRATYWTFVWVHYNPAVLLLQASNIINAVERQLPTKGAIFWRLPPSIEWDVDRNSYKLRMRLSTYPELPQEVYAQLGYKPEGTEVKHVY